MSNKLTTAAGCPVADNQNVKTAGPRGPQLLEDVWFLEKLAHFDREVIPERRMHAKGSGAYGSFTVTQDISTYTRAGDSGQAIHHQSCNNCGVTVCAEVTVGGFYSVNVATLSDHADLRPNMAIYTASAPAWALFPQDVPQYEFLPTQFA